ncbi:hypothetical protein CLF_101827 [Clonorchis sinensis]|uniref:Uncharacterized protein n=1 Tax=Clonorchis sinensis TaxID=79923 RepID=G7Y6N3_CLOSI|nr:hypothetical protein CLF_101827 [Clonorchis sinensis]
MGEIRHKAVIMITVDVVTHFNYSSSLQHASPVSMCDADYEASPIHSDLIYWPMTVCHNHNCKRFQSCRALVVTARPTSMCDAAYEASPSSNNLIQRPMTASHAHICPRFLVCAQTTNQNAGFCVNYMPLNNDESGRRKGPQAIATEIFDHEGRNCAPKTREGKTPEQTGIQRDEKRLANEKQLSKPTKEEADKYAAESSSEPFTQALRSAIKPTILSGSNACRLLSFGDSRKIVKRLFNQLPDIKQSACLEQPSIIALTETLLTPNDSDAKILIGCHYLST